MKIIISLLIPVLFLLNCCELEDITPGEPLFNAQLLTSLELENLTDFWQGDSIIVKMNPSLFFNTYDGFTGGIEYRSDRKSIEVEVFNSKKTALAAIEEFRQMISMYTIESSNHSIIQERWWHAPNSFLTILVNKENTFIAVHCGLEREASFIQNIAAEIINRIAQKSN